MLTKEQRALRQGHIGASEMPALFNEHIKMTGVDLWLEKAYGLEEETKESESIQMGEVFEKPMVKWAAAELGVEILTAPKQMFAICKEHPILAATLDSRILPRSRHEAIEGKTSSIDGVDFGGKDNEWGDPETDQVPNRVIIQCQQQMLCHNLDRVYVAALLGRMGLKRHLYKIERNDEIIAAIIQRGEWFWESFVVSKRQPPELDEDGNQLFGLGSLDIIRRVRRIPQTWAEVPDDLILDWDDKRQARLDAQKIEREALSRMLTQLGNAEGVRLSDGRTLEYYPVTKRMLDQKRLAAERPDVYFDMLHEVITKTPRLKKGE